MSKFLRWTGITLIISMLPTLAFANPQTPVSDAENLTSIISRYSDGIKRADAFSATYYNVEEDLDKFGDYLSPEYFDRYKKLYKAALSDLKKINTRALAAKDLRTYKLFKEDMEISLRYFDYPSEYLDFNQMGNRIRYYIDDSSPSLTYFPFDSVKHYEAFIKRSEGFPIYIDRQIDLLKKGIKKKIILNCVVADKAIKSIQEGLEPEVEKNPFWRPTTVMPKEFAAADQERIKAGFKMMISDRILPSLRKFDTYFRKEYMPHCRQGYGLSDLKNGKDWYAFQILANTNLKLSAQDVHNTGLKEVERIAAEMEAIRKEIKFEGDFKAFLHSLTHDEKYYYKSASEMFQAFDKVKKEIAKKIPNYFSLTPKTDYQLAEAGNPEEASASYKVPTEMTPLGRFIINTKNLKAVPNYEVTTLSLHEAVPGHHFQLALQYEMKDQLSEYQRKIFNSTSFVEGWALYAEYLGREMGAFKDTMQRLGNLNAEMLRAVRLVVDSGIHGFGWSREKVIQYMSQHLASDMKDIETEADRYSVLPGQALAYKIGQLKIIQLRKLAEKELGTKFDIKEFHKGVIGYGTVSLSILEQQIAEWIESVRSQKPKR